MEHHKDKIHLQSETGNQVIRKQGGQEKQNKPNQGHKEENPENEKRHDKPNPNHDKKYSSDLVFTG